MMMTEKTQCIGVFIASMICAQAASAQTQFIPPDPTDLHSAYCIEIDKTSIAQTAKWLAAMPPSPPASDASNTRAQLMEKERQTVKAGLERQQAALRRIQLYLIPRIDYLDITGIAAAASAAQTDLQRLFASSNACINACPNAKTLQQAQQCMHACRVENMPDFDTVEQKITDCQNPSWLPF